MLAAVILLCAFMGLPPAHAQIVQVEIGTSPNPVGSGARALGVGNAFIALADDATAASWNPGGLAQLERPELSLAMDHVSRREHSDSGTYPGVDATHGIDVTNLNYASAVFPFYIRRPMVASISYLKQYNFDKELSFPLVLQNGPITQDFTHDFDQSGNFSVVTPAFAVDITDRLSLGLAVNIWNHGITGSSEYSKEERSEGTLTFGPQSSTFTQTRDETFTVDSGYSLVLGGLYRFSPQWNVGVVVKPPYELRIDHDTETDWVQTGGVGNAGSPPDPTSETGKLHMPLILGGGVAWRPSDHCLFTSDVTWTQWSRYRFEENGEETSPISAKDYSDSDVKDTFTLRLGAEYFIFRESHIWTLRTGVGYDPSPAEGGVDDYYTFSLGGGLQYRGINIDVAYELRYGRGVGASSLLGLDADEDICQHRVMLSLIAYF